MKDFKKFGDKRGGDRGGFGGKPRFNKFDGDRPVVLHKTTCAECGKGCEVPFRPNGEKPVFCNDCFGAKRGTDGGNFERPQRFDAPRQSFSRPEPRSESRSESRPDPRIDGLVQQMSSLNSKLDTLISLMTPAKAESKPEKKVEAKSAPVAKKVVAKAPAKKAAVKKVAAKKK